MFLGLRSVGSSYDDKVARELKLAEAREEFALRLLKAAVC